MIDFQNPESYNTFVNQVPDLIILLSLFYSLLNPLYNSQIKHISIRANIRLIKRRSKDFVHKVLKFAGSFVVMAQL